MSMSNRPACPKLDELLAQRAARYGTFEGTAHTAQALKRVMHDAPGWVLLTDTQREGLEMIQMKVARMLNGDPTYLDNIVDICGSAELVREAMTEARRSATSNTDTGEP